MAINKFERWTQEGIPDIVRHLIVGLLTFQLPDEVMVFLANLLFFLEDAQSEMGAYSIVVVAYGALNLFMRWMFVTRRYNGPLPQSSAAPSGAAQMSTYRPKLW